MSDGKIPIRRPAQVNTVGEIPQSPQPKYPSDIIDLPTKGWFYAEGNPLSVGHIEIKQVTAREEDILANQDLIRKGIVLEKLLSSLLVNKQINYKDIFTPDKNAIFVNIRRLSYGDTYPVSVTCPSCREKNRIEIDLSKLENKDIDVEKFPKGINRFSFILPKSNVTVTYKLLNQIDDDAIDKELEGLKKINKENASEVTTRLKYLITSVAGNEDKEYIRKFIDEELLAVDARSLREYIRETTPDIDMRFDFKCNRCEFERRMDIPVGASFLWPDLES